MKENLRAQRPLSSRGRHAGYNDDDLGTVHAAETVRNSRTSRHLKTVMNSITAGSTVHLRCDLSKAHWLVDPNGSGKTAVLEAINLATSTGAISSRIGESDFHNFETIQRITEWSGQV